MGKTYAVEPIFGGMETSFSSSAPSSVERIVEAVAAHADTDPLELPPLYEAIDADALDALFREGCDGSVQFRYADRDVTFYSEGSVEIDGEAVRDAELVEQPTDD